MGWRIVISFNYDNHSILLVYLQIKQTKIAFKPCQFLFFFSFMKRGEQNTYV